MDAEMGRWFQDVGRDKSANKPLLRIIFQTPLVLLSASLLKDTLEIWNNIPKPKDKQDASFHDYFVLDVVGLSHYQYAKIKFIEDVNELRKRFSSPSEVSLQIKPLVPAVDFVRSTSEIWDRVVNDKALDIPSHKMMIAKVRCEQINNDKFNAFVTNEEWSQLKVTSVNIPRVSCFGIKITSMVDKCLAEYDEEAEFYDEVVKADHREKLKQRLLQTESACSEFRVGLEDLGTNIDTAKVEAEAGEMLKEYGREIIEKSVRKESDNLLRVMHQKFCYILLNEPDSDIPRSWKGSDKIQVIVKRARVECINIMSVMAIMRLDINKESDDVQQILHNALLEGGGEGSLTSSNWNGVEASKTLMSPAACATIWDQFLKSSGIIIASVNQAIQARIDADNNQVQGRKCLFQPEATTHNSVKEGEIEKSVLGKIFNALQQPNIFDLAVLAGPEAEPNRFNFVADLV
ncbi:protein ROOT HAIR DEFECTIVE 3-like [Impatiens glandulifera]|uniref:protein ROOT HAIR DEFECTIVE 3-like n=1 Tax=Impatiens glandulifera TaxID=253017 RepID=UPI001FB0B596|nr:protein ROOT HAIR DEFECTIVE 3-like [Impatiens glandulifera]